MHPNRLLPANALYAHLHDSESDKSPTNFAGQRGNKGPDRLSRLFRDAVYIGRVSSLLVDDAWQVSGLQSLPYVSCPHPGRSATGTLSECLIFPSRQDSKLLWP